MKKFIKVARTSEIDPGTGKCVEVAGERIAIFNVEGQFYAIEDTCTHAEGSLSEGTLTGEEVECPLHGACFNIKTGEATTPPAITEVKTYNVKVSGGEIEIAVRE